MQLLSIGSFSTTITAEVQIFLELIGIKDEEMEGYFRVFSNNLIQVCQKNLRFRQRGLDCKQL